MSLLTSAATTFGLPELIEARVGERAYSQVCGQRSYFSFFQLYLLCMDWCTTLHVQIGGMNAQRFGEFFVQTRQQLDPDELVFLIYDGAPAHGNAANPGANTQLKMLLPYSAFLNIVEQAISTLKAALKADISQQAIQKELNNRDEARPQEHGQKLRTCKICACLEWRPDGLCLFIGKLSILKIEWSIFSPKCGRHATIIRDTFSNKH